VEPMSRILFTLIQN